MSRFRDGAATWLSAVGGAVLTSIAFASSATLAAGAGSSVDSPVDAGMVVITEPNRLVRPISSGDSNSSFSLMLPEGASCPGDSYSEDWRVQSFIVPAVDDPGTLRYGIIWPEGEGRRSLYSATTRPFIHILTGRAIAPGEPGPIVQPEPMTFAVYPSGAFPAGRYRIGIACSQYRETATFWDTEIVISDAPDVEPGAFRWVLADDVEQATRQPSSSDGSAPQVLIFVVLGAAVVTAVVVTGRRRSQAHLTRQEQP